MPPRGGVKPSWGYGVSDTDEMPLSRSTESPYINISPQYDAFGPHVLAQRCSAGHNGQLLPSLEIMSINHSSCLAESARLFLVGHMFPTGDSVSPRLLPPVSDAVFGHWLRGIKAPPSYIMNTFTSFHLFN